MGDEEALPEDRGPDGRLRYNTRASPSTTSDDSQMLTTPTDVELGSTQIPTTTLIINRRRATERVWPYFEVTTIE